MISVACGGLYSKSGNEMEMGRNASGGRDRGRSVEEEVVVIWLGYVF